MPTICPFERVTEIPDGATETKALAWWVKLIAVLLCFI